MCHISGFNEKYFAWSTFEHSGCHIIYVKLNYKEFFFEIIDFHQKFPIEKYFLGDEIFEHDFENSHEKFSKSQ